ncbi:MAG TPA: NAD-dependent epimerase/dehydratase family protein, partial [Pseudonocardiaceae bacterium]|nr:NAD-dependent epimerase/dehydratase family protein [Pseudonocardiaceae bacterium]
MRVLVLGGDGYLGWPIALHLSYWNHDVAILDSFVRRRYDDELGTESLVPIESLDTRITTWRALSGNHIEQFTGDLTEPDVIYEALRRFRPHAVVHLAEQRSAPYSMMDR